MKREKEFFKYLDSEISERIRMKILIDSGKVIDIVVQYESFLNNKWTPIIRYDCAHGFFHRDVLSPSGEKEKQTIAIRDLENALLYAEQDIKDRWNFYKQRYTKKLKK
ncbi:MAG: hypothetical protein KGZ58_07800 [Ignavibacteriales bacterium]|nr:hypothetical protein [Ignavibacteriales bacterium]